MPLRRGREKKEWHVKVWEKPQRGMLKSGGVLTTDGPMRWEDAQTKRNAYIHDGGIEPDRVTIER